MFSDSLPHEIGGGAWQQLMTAKGGGVHCLSNAFTLNQI